MRYAHCIRLIAENAPLRILPVERVVGSATLREATGHAVPIYGKASVSHTTIGFDDVLKVGYKGLRKQIDERLARGGLDAKGLDLLNAMNVCLDAADRWHRRYIDSLDRADRRSPPATSRPDYERVLENLRNVPENPPADLRGGRAVALVHVRLPAAVRQLVAASGGSTRCSGRTCKRDLAAGQDHARRGPRAARPLLDQGHRVDRQQPQAAAAATRSSTRTSSSAGVDADGNEVTNEVTYLVLDVVEELHISDFPIAVRLNRNSPEKLLRAHRRGPAARRRHRRDLQRGGGHRRRWSSSATRSRRRAAFANDGCWEVLIPGKTAFIYRPFDTLLLPAEGAGLSTTAAKSPGLRRLRGPLRRVREGAQAAAGRPHRAGASDYCRNAAPGDAGLALRRGLHREAGAATTTAGRSTPSSPRTPAASRTRPTACWRSRSSSTTRSC